MSCQDEKISLLQGRSGQNRTKSVKPGLPRRKAKPEVGHRCDRVQFVWRETVSVPNSRSAQQRSGQLYHIGSPCAQHGDNHAERGICKNSRRNKPHSPFFFGLPKSELLYLQEFRSMEHFKQELVAYLDYYNIRRIKAKLKGLPPAIHRQQTLSAA